MNTNLTREEISALVDGELDESRIEAVLALLHEDEGRTAWEAYHQAGDALRSDEIALSMSRDFSKRLFDRLEAEPAIIAPMSPARVAASAPQPQSATTVLASRWALKRLALPGMVAAAAVATVAFITTPHLMVADGTPDIQQVVPATPQPALTNAALNSAAITTPAVAVQTTTDEEVMLRDPRIDDYLFAHQRFSSSVYSTAQFARSATFASSSGN
ncbi:MAG TPA: sigma-E factor negative regulatory protein [Burkholderiaceae bacterium]|nr:sigma-E factor negative regulatory protein [Burkholderiaceae bacterium]